MIQVTDPLNQATKYSYDELGNRVSQADVNGHVTTLQYDRLRRRTQRALPLGMSESMVYDAAGNPAGRTDFRGKTTTFTYDTRNRLLSRIPDPSLGEPTVTFTYTPTGRRATMSDAAGMTTYSYDNCDRLVAKAGGQGTLTYTRDAVGNVLSIRSSSANGTYVNYSYDQLNRPSTVTDSHLGSTPATYSFDQAGNLAGVVYPNGVQSGYSYDKLNHLLSLTVAKGGTTLNSYSYSLGPVGNRLGLTEATSRQASFAYDSLYRLTSQTITNDPDGANGSISYTYDPAGNRLSRTSSVVGVPAASSTYDTNDRLNSDGYDLNGSTTGSGGNSYGYDFEGHLTVASGGSMLYDGDGNRVAMTNGGVTTVYLVDTENPTGLPQVMEETVGSSVQRVYTYGVNRISQSQLVSGVWTTSFYGYDGQGSVRFLLDTGGNITDRYTYDAFGNEVAVSGATPNVYRYVGEAFDQGLQLTYLRARYLNRATGRFWTADAAGGDAFDPAGLHRYLYAGGDPVNNSDPLGLFTTMMGDAVHFYLGVHFMATGVKRDLFRFFDDQSKGGLRPALWKIAANVAGGAAVKLAKATTGLDRIPDLVDLTNKALFEIKPIGKRAGGPGAIERMSSGSTT